MKSFLIFSLLSMNVFAAADWVSLGETENCPEKVEVFAKEGEKFIEVSVGNKRTKLFSVDKSAYVKDTPRTTEFTSLDKSLTYFQPGMADGNPPKLSLMSSGSKEICKLVLK